MTMKKALSAMVVALMIAVSAQAELRRAEIKVFGMD
jgi:hypothetical protein